MFRQQFTDVQDAWILAHAIVDTVREPSSFSIKIFRVVAASQSFYLKFKVEPDHTLGKLLYNLGDGQWDIPSSVCCWERFFPNRELWRIIAEHDFPALDTARCS